MSWNGGVRAKLGVLLEDAHRWCGTKGGTVQPGKSTQKAQCSAKPDAVTLGPLALGVEVEPSHHCHVSQVKCAEEPMCVHEVREQLWGNGSPHSSGER